MVIVNASDSWYVLLPSWFPLTPVRPMTRGRPTMVAYGVGTMKCHVVLGYVDASLNN